MTICNRGDVVLVPFPLKCTKRIFRFEVKKISKHDKI